MQTFSLNGHEHIALCDLLKLTGLADSGGQAKTWIAETRKTAKILAGEIIELDNGSAIKVQE